ncbi:MAG: hypothetical protein AAF438_05185 [Pseudomonadota bacterium]
MTGRYNPLNSRGSGSGRRFREQEHSDVPTHLPTIRFTGKLTISDEFPRLGNDPYNHVGTHLRDKDSKQ